MFDWLRHQSFIQQGPYGLFPHDLAREVLDADLRWRNPEDHATLQALIAGYLRRQWHGARGQDQQRLRLEILYANRHHPGIGPFFAWDDLDSGYAEPAGTEDHAAIIEMVRAHQGKESANIAEYWLRRQPAAFSVFRKGAVAPTGFMANLSLRKSTPEDRLADPAVPAALAFVERHGPPRSDEDILYLRFWMSRERYQAVSAAVNLTAINSVISWLTHPALAWNFIAMANPDFWMLHFDSIHMHRSPDADFEVGGWRYGVFSHDWRVEPASVWSRVRLQRDEVLDQEERNSACSSGDDTLTQGEFGEAVRKALRDFTRLDLLSTNSLAQSSLVDRDLPGSSAAERLRALLVESIAILQGNPRDLKLHRALWHTYVEPAGTQERAAELLDLPFTTYRTHLTKGIARVTAWLWQRYGECAEHRR
jgi:hypothetical protein